VIYTRVRKSAVLNYVIDDIAKPDLFDLVNLSVVQGLEIQRKTGSTAYAYGRGVKPLHYGVGRRVRVAS